MTTTPETATHNEHCCMEGAWPGWGPHPDCPGVEALRALPGDRVSVDKAALMAFIAEADATRMQRDQEFVCGRAEQADSDSEFAALVEALGITSVPAATPAPTPK